MTPQVAAYLAFAIGAAVMTAGLALVEVRLGVLFAGGLLMLVSAPDVLGGGGDKA